MHFALCVLLFSVSGIWATPTSTQANDDQNSKDSITKDIVIIGGGSSGTYAAIRLQQLGYSVAVIERQPALGGHVDTFRDPVTNETFDYGVISFDNITVVQDYFDYFDIPLAPVSYASSNSFYASFQSDGKIVQIPSSVPWSNETASGIALLSYGSLLDNYPYLVNGFDLPDPVPEDLLISYGDFLDKYDLGALAYIAFEYIQGVGNILAQPTLYVMKYFAQVTVNAILGNGVQFLTTENHDNQALYDKALAKLGDNAFVSSNVTAIKRSNNNVQVAVTTPSGPEIINAKKVLIAIQPTFQNLLGLGLDLDTEEKDLFTQFNNSYYWDMVIRNSGIPDNVTLNNVDLSASLALPALPGLYTISWSGLPGLHEAYYGSPSYLSDDEVKADTIATLKKIAQANGYSDTDSVEFVGFNNHAPFELTVSVEAIQSGFYRKLNGIQGQRNTWWTGATWQAHDSSQIWNWTEYTLLPQIVASL